MTHTKDEALKLALEALDSMHIVDFSLEDLASWNKAFKAIKQALAAPTVQEPVALEGGKRLIVVDQSFDDLMYWLDRCEDKGHLENCPDLVEPWSAFQYEIYTTPPAAQPAQPAPTVQEPAGCQHKRYSVDAREGTGTCHDCGAEGQMQFVVGQ